MACGGSSPARTAGTWSDFGNCLDNVVAGDTITVTANLNANSGLGNKSIPANVTVQGLGYSSTVTGGGDVITITDNETTGTTLVNFLIGAAGTFKIRGLTIAGGSGTDKQNGIMGFFGPGTMRMDHMHWNEWSYSPNINSAIFFIGNGVYGVADHCIFDLYTQGSVKVTNGSGAGAQGNEVWAAATAFGGADFMFFENNIFNGHTDSTSRISDNYSGGRSVWRYNTLKNCSGPEVHATGHSSDDRGARATEFYNNQFSLISGQTQPTYDFDDVGSGCHLIWGNVADTDSVKNGIVLNVTRKDMTTYDPSSGLNGWGFCGATPVATGTVTVTGTTVAWASGDHFDTGWPANSAIIITGATCAHPGMQPGPGTGCLINSVTSTIALSVQQTTNLTAATATFYVGSNWDGNADITGYPCLDQPGRGMGDLLTTYFVPNGTGKLNHTQSDADWTSVNAWPRQALEPVYIFQNTFTPAAGYGGSGFFVDNSGGRVVADRDYYAQASGENLSKGTPFDGTTGTGWGTRTNRPDTCTSGVGYWSTDQGSWNISGSGGQGVLDLCVASAWVNDSYHPYQYPHPLTLESTPSPVLYPQSTPPASHGRRGRKVGMY